MRNNGVWLSIVGIGEDGWEGLDRSAKRALEEAELIVGGERHLALLPPTRAERIAWPSPMLPFIDEILGRHRSRAVAVLASGDPMLCGVGAVFARRLDPAEFRVIPHPSAFALACARLGWPSAEVSLISAVSRPLERVLPYVQPGRRLIVFSQDDATPGALAALLIEHGYGTSALSVFERLGGPHERRLDGTAASWPVERCADLNVVAVTCLADEGTVPLSTVPGLPDDVFEIDGQLTKREVRAATLARLIPLPGQLLWDVGAGSGSIGIEWMRVDRSCRSIAFERDHERARRIARNAHRLGTPGLVVVAGQAPATFRGVEPPDAIFIGGGIGTPHLIEACWEALPHGGRLVANAVTIEGETALVQHQSSFGGELVRIAVSRAEPIGSMLTFRPLLPITQWAVRKS